MFLLNAAQANCFLLTMSSELPKKLPRYLHYFHSVFDVLLIVYSSVLSWLTMRFLFVRIVEIVCLISSMIFMFVVAQEVSSAYCCSMVKAFLYLGYFLMFVSFFVVVVVACVYFYVSLLEESLLFLSALWRKKMNQIGEAQSPWGEPMSGLNFFS